MNDNLLLGELTYLRQHVHDQVVANEHDDYGILVLAATDNRGYKDSIVGTAVGSTDQEGDKHIPPLLRDVPEYNLHQVFFSFIIVLMTCIFCATFLLLLVFSLRGQMCFRLSRFSIRFFDGHKLNHIIT